MKISLKSPETTVVKTVCEKCGCSGYIFPDQLPRGVELGVRDAWYAKCCNGRARKEKRARIRGFIDTNKAYKLQKIRKRGTTINPNDAVANF